jgi:hypothetical protein
MCISYTKHILEIIVIVKYSNLLVCFSVVVMAQYMLGVCLAGAWRAVGRRSELEGGCKPGQVSIYH